MKTPEIDTEDFKIRERENARLKLIERLEIERKRKVNECIRNFYKPWTKLDSKN